MGMPSFGTWTFFTLCITIALYWVGIPSSLTYVLGVNPSHGQAYGPDGNPVYGGKPFEQTTFLQRLGQLFSTNSGIAALIGFFLAGVAVSALTGFSSMYFVPVIILLFITNFTAMPITNELLAPACINTTTECVGTSGGVPEFIYYPMLLLFNIVSLMASISFIRGGV
jgi:hypothetical protein